jgi:hypothetical protein
MLFAACNDLRRPLHRTHSVSVVIEMIYLQGSTETLINALLIYLIVLGNQGDARATVWFTAENMKAAREISDIESISSFITKLVNKFRKGHAMPMKGKGQSIANEKESCSFLATFQKESRAHRMSVAGPWLGVKSRSSGGVGRLGT